MRFSGLALFICSSGTLRKPLRDRTRSPGRFTRTLSVWNRVFAPLNVDPSGTYPSR